MGEILIFFDQFSVVFFLVGYDFLEFFYFVFQAPDVLDVGHFLVFLDFLLQKVYLSFLTFQLLQVFPINLVQPLLKLLDGLTLLTNYLPVYLVHLPNCSFVGRSFHDLVAVAKLSIVNEEIVLHSGLDVNKKGFEIVVDLPKTFYHVKGVSDQFFV